MYSCFGHGQSFPPGCLYAGVFFQSNPDHYKVYMEEVIPAMPLKYKLLTKIALKLGAIQVEQLTHMQSDICFYCKFGSGGHDKKSELPPIE